MHIKTVASAGVSRKGFTIAAYLEGRRLRRAGIQLRKAVNVTEAQAKVLAETNKEANWEPAVASHQFAMLRRLDQFQQGTPQHEAAFAYALDIIRKARVEKRQRA